MAKALTKVQPSSSVAGMLESGIGMRVLARAPEIAPDVNFIPVVTPTTIAPAISKSPPLTGELASIDRQFTLTPTTDKILKRLIGLYGDAAELDLKQSELIRAILTAAAHAMPELIRESAGIGKIKRPKNERGNEAKRDQLERKIAAAFVAGMRAARRFEL